MSLHIRSPRRNIGHRRREFWLAAIALLLWPARCRERQRADQDGCPQRWQSRTAKADAAAAADANDPKLGQDWVRMQYDADGEVLGMQTAIVRYAAAAPLAKPAVSAVQVDLIGAVHIADVAYYNQLNERFKQYDALLYELVAPEGTVVERGRGTSNAHPLGAMQNWLKDVLGTRSPTGVGRLHEAELRACRYVARRVHEGDEGSQRNVSADVLPAGRPGDGPPERDGGQGPVVRLRFVLGVVCRWIARGG